MFRQFPSEVRYLMALSFSRYGEDEVDGDYTSEALRVTSILSSMISFSVIDDFLFYSSCWPS